MHASEAYKWMDVMGDISTYTNDHSNDGVSNETGSTNNRSNEPNSQTGKDNNAIGNKNEGDKALDSSCYEGWREGTCIRWNGVYGFLSVMIQNPLYSFSNKISVDSNIDDAKGHSMAVSIRVYAHYKSLFFDPPRMQLRKGERVRILVKEADRGPRAVRVESTAVRVELMGSEG